MITNENGNIPTRELRKVQNSLYSLQKEFKTKLLDNPLWIPNDLKKYATYEESLKYAFLKGFPKTDRTGTATIGIHGYQSRFNLDDGFPLITTKKVHTKSIIHELLWFLKGDTNIKYLKDNGVTIWDEWADKNGDLGPIYGKQWTAWDTYEFVKGHSVPGTTSGTFSFIPDAYKKAVPINQLQNIVDMINAQHKTGVISRRMLVSAWNVADVPSMKLPPCHLLFQFHSRIMKLDERQNYWAELSGRNISFFQDMTDDMLDIAGAPIYALDLQLYQRSCDMFLGVPFNIASYALLSMMVAQVTNTKPGDFIHTLGDVHIYTNHLEQMVEQLSREPRPYPKMKIINRGQKIDGFAFEDFELIGYEPHPAIKATVAV